MDYIFHHPVTRPVHGEASDRHAPLKTRAREKIVVDIPSLNSESQMPEKIEKISHHRDPTVSVMNVRSPAAADGSALQEASDAAEAWTKCIQALKEHDEVAVKGWKEEIDTLLVFAGLFSAVLTAFNIESYKLLQPQLDPAQTTNAILMQISAQLGSFSMNTGFVNSTDPPFALPPLSNPPVPASAIAVNALWFSSLICSLAAASVGILVKQWLNQYASGLASISPQEARIRQFRYDNLEKWRVVDVMTVLPILLQSALVLFLVGLLLFLNMFPSRTVFYVASILVAVLLLFTAITTVMPTFIGDCSYQSPQAWGLFVVTQALKQPIRKLCKRIFAHLRTSSDIKSDHTAQFWRFHDRIVARLARFSTQRNSYNWPERERILVENSGPILDRHLLAAADATFMDDSFLKTVVHPCLNGMSPDLAIECYYDIMSRRADGVMDGVFYWDSYHTRFESIVLLTDLTLDMLVKTRSQKSDDRVRMLKNLEPMLTRSLPRTYQHFCDVLFHFLDDEQDVRRLAFRTIHQQLLRNPDLVEQFASTGCHDISALTSYIHRAQADNNADNFLNACDLVIHLATVEKPPDECNTDMQDDLQHVLRHLRQFFETPIWRSNRKLIYPISRILPHIVRLAKGNPDVIDDDFMSIMNEVTTVLEGMNEDGNWEDKLIIMRDALGELRQLSHRRRVRSHDDVVRADAPTASIVRPPLPQTKFNIQTHIEHDIVNGSGVHQDA